MKRIWVCLTILGLMAGGCGRIDHQASFPQNKPIALGADLGGERQYSLVRHFREKERQVFFFLHWFPLNQAGGIKAAEKKLDEGDGIANLAIRTYYGPVDLFFTLITGGLITTYTVDTDGDIVRLATTPTGT